MTPEESERGHRASFDPRTGEVHGSGSGAGGGGNPAEDFDSDAVGGGGQEPEHGARDIDHAVDRPIDRDENI
jgi:hypothetical protein